MEYITKTINGAEFMFCVSARNTRSGFAHDCVLLHNGRMIAHDTAHYLNRTWESYRFQSVMLGAVDNAICEARERIEQDEKTRNGWQRLTAERRAHIDTVVDANAAIITLRDLLDAVRNAHYGTEEKRERLETLDALNAMLELLFHPATA